MNSATYPLFSRIIGTSAGFAAYFVARLLFILPDSALLPLLGVLRATIGSLSGRSPAYRAIDDIHFVLGGGGEGARIFRALVTRSRPSDIIGIVRGAVIRSLG